MGKKSAPKAPDYSKLATQQAQQQNDLLSQQTWANRPDQNDPYGSISWNAVKSVDPVTGKPVTKWEQNTTLNPQLQAALQSQFGLTQDRSQLAQQLFGGVAGQLGQGVNTQGFTGWGQVPGMGSIGAGQGVQQGLNFGGIQNVQDAAATRQKAEDAYYQSATARLDPQWQQQQTQLETQLANKGITAGSAAYQQALDQFNRQKTDAYGQARNQAISGAGAEAQRDFQNNLGLRQQQANEVLQGGNFANSAQGQAFGQQNTLFNQGITAGQFGNQQRAQQFAEALQQRGLGQQDINWLLGGANVQGPQGSSFSQAGNAQTPDLLGAAQAQYGAATDAKNASNAKKTGTASAVATAAAAF